MALHLTCGLRNTGTSESQKKKVEENMLRCKSRGSDRERADVFVDKSPKISIKNLGCVENYNYS